MYSYIPHEFRLQGLSLGELIFGNFDKSMRAQKEYVEIALKFDKANIKFVPAQYIIDEQKDKKFSLEKFIKSFDNNPEELAVFLKNLYSEKEKIYNFSFMENYKFVAEQIVNSYYDCDSCESLLESFHKSHPLFTDVAFAKKVFSHMKKSLSVPNEAYVLSEIIDKSSIGDKLREDMEIAPILYVGSGNYRGYAGIVESIKNSPELLLKLLKAVYSKPKKEIEDVQSIYSFMDYLPKKHLENEEFMTELLILLPEKILDVDSVLSYPSPKLMKDMDAVHRLLARLVKNGKDLNCADWYMKDIHSFVKKNPDLAKFAINNVSDFFFSYTDGYFHKGTFESNKIAVTMLPLIDVESMSKSMVKHWIFELKRAEDDVKEIIRGEHLKSTKDLENVINKIKKELLK